MIEKNKTSVSRGKPFFLSGSLDYQEGSIVSKVLIGKPSGNVTLFSFDKGQGLSEHTAPFDALVCVLSGSARVNISGRPATLKAGEAIILPAGKPHSLRAMSKFKMMLVMVKK